MRCAARWRIYPATYDFLLKTYELVKAGQARLVDMIVGFIDPNAPDVIAQPQNPDQGGDRSPPRRSRTKRRKATRKPTRTRKSSIPGPIRPKSAARLGFDRQALQHVLGSIAKLGAKDPKTLQPAQDSLADEFMELKLSPRMFDALIAQSAHPRSEIRQLEKEIMVIAVRDAGMPRKDFIATFPKNETSARWLAKHVKARQEVLRAARALEGRDRAAPEEARAAREPPPPVDQRHQGNQPRGLDRRGQGAARQEGDGRGEPAAGDLDRQEVHQPRAAVPRSDPGRQHRPDEGGRQVRIPPRLQVLAPTRPGGSARRSPARSPIRRAPSASRCT